MEVKYECGVCGEQFDDEDEANECCQPEETNENEEDE
jgi:DNA-directed RNA polymerase subunit RPC12/RpoP